jgi:hypothetical protein
LSELQRAGRTDEFADGCEAIEAEFAFIFVLVFTQEVSASVHQSLRRVFLHKSPWNVARCSKRIIFRHSQLSAAPFLLSDLVSAALEPNSKPSLISLRLQCLHISFLISLLLRRSADLYRFNSPGPFCWIDSSGFAAE